MTRSIRIDSFTGSLVILLLLLSLSCDESLPIYTPPTDFLQADVKVFHVTTKVGEIYADIFLAVHNRYSETFSDTASVKGELVISWSGNGHSLKKSFPISSSSIALIGISGTEYNPTTKIMTLPTNDSVNFQFRWNYLSDNSFFIPDSFKYYPTSENPREMVSKVENIYLNAKVQLYKQTSYVHSEPFIHARTYNEGWVALP